MKECWNRILGLLLKREKDILLMGLSNTGKSTLVDVLKTGRIRQTVPTLHGRTEHVYVGQSRFKMYELSSVLPARWTWAGCVAQADGVVFMIDAVDRSRWAEAKNEFANICAIIRSLPVSIPMVVLCNKIDDTAAPAEADILKFLFTNLESYNATFRMELFMTSVVQRTGYVEALEWLSHVLESQSQDAPRQEGPASRHLRVQSLWSKLAVR